MRHSLSPAIFELIGKHVREDVRYILLDVEAPGFAEAVSQARGAGFAGLNVTIPHKAAALKVCHTLSKEAAEIGAVNVLKFGRGGTKGYNTDGPAMLDCLSGYALSGKRAVVFGAGGAARAVCWALGKARVRTVTVRNRTRPRAKKLTAHFSRIFPKTVFKTRAGSHADIWINATPASFRCPGKGELAMDLVYKPADTLFLKTAAKKGLRSIYGLDMLVFQALRSWDLFFSRLPDREGLRQSLKRRLWRSVT